MATDDVGAKPEQTAKLGGSVFRTCTRRGVVRGEQKWRLAPFPRRVGIVSGKTLRYKYSVVYMDSARRSPKHLRCCMAIGSRGGGGVILGMFWRKRSSGSSTMRSKQTRRQSSRFVLVLRDFLKTPSRSSRRPPAY